MLDKELSKHACYCCYEDIRNNLIDAGCDENTIEVCLENLMNDNKANFLNLLHHHRDNLLQNIHQKQKQLDCLDFLICKLEKCEEGKKED